MPRISIVVAVARNGAIGYQNKLLYRLKADMKRFKTLTTGHTVLMGRRTFESLPKGALPNRRNIVLTRSRRKFEGTEVYPSLQEALTHCADDEHVFIIGGSSVYNEALSNADTLYLTEVDDCPADADTFFPDFSREQWREVSRESFPADAENECPYSFVTLERLR